MPTAGSGEDVDGHRLSEVLAEFAHMMTTDVTVPAILGCLVARAVDVLAVAAAGVTLRSPGPGQGLVAASDEASLSLEELQSELGDGPGAEAYRTGAAVAVPDATGEGGGGPLMAHAAHAGLGAMFAFPLCNGGTRFGALDLYCSEPTRLSPAAMAAAQTLADVAASHIGNVRARDDLRRTLDHARSLLRRDELTGVVNRAGILEELGRAAREASRPGHSVAVLFADLDGFKQVNDTHGHQIGDELLVAVASRLSAVLRAGDTVGRLSGDEFVIVCDDLRDSSEADLLARRVTAALADPFALSSATVAVTVSSGVAFATTGDHRPADLLHAADLATYHAKRHQPGRHHLVTVDDDRPTAPAPVDDTQTPPDSTDADPGLRAARSVRRRASAPASAPTGTR